MGGPEWRVLKLTKAARLRAWFIAFLFFALSALFSVCAQTATNPAASSALDSEQQLQSRLAAIRLELANLSAVNGSNNLPEGATSSEVGEYRSLLEFTLRTTQQHLLELGRLPAARQRLKDLEQTAATSSRLEGFGPYSILVIDDLRDKVHSFSIQITADQTSLDVLAKFKTDNELSIKSSEERLRLLTENLEIAKDPSTISALKWQRTLEQARNRREVANVAQNETQRKLVTLDLAESKLRLELAQRQLTFASQHGRFSQEDLDGVLAAIDNEAAQLAGELKTAQAESEASQAAVSATRDELNKLLQAPVDAGATNAANQQAKTSALQKLLELRNAQASTSAQRVLTLQQLQQLLFLRREAWQSRLETFGSRDALVLERGAARLQHMNDAAEAAKPYFVQQIDLLNAQISEQESRIQNKIGTEADLSHAHDLLKTLQQRLEPAYRGLRGLQQVERLGQRWQQSLDESRHNLPLAGRLRDLFSGLSSLAPKLWQFELFSAEDTITIDGQTITGRRSVTVGKIVMALLILAIGYLLSIWVAGFLERLAVGRFKVEPNQAGLIRRWAKVVLIISLIVFSLISVKIPLTIFAFLGGALAIGLGFGTQNLLKNFISGIIILFERPFRVGDVLEVGGQRGTITSIGIRSSVLLLWDSTETLIPNSALLENNLTNWTYSNHIVRFTLSVGVAFGSDTRRVAQLLAEVAERHGLVQKEPKPQVLFLDFGESTLQFELRYWVNVLADNAAQIGSDLRHMISNEFAANGISIAFPQRVLHINASQTLPVQILTTPAPAPRPPESM
jgi:small-conductance mechanosensitive channel